VPVGSDIHKERNRFPNSVWYGDKPPGAIHIEAKILAQQMRGVFMDRYLILIVTLLVATLTAFFLGLIPYPAGWLLFTVLFFIRHRKIRKKRGKKASGQ
jgi:hypothetical protein